MNSYLFSQAEKNSRFGKLVSDNSSIVQYRSSKANSEEAGITRGWYHQSQLIINYLVQYLYNHMIYYLPLQPVPCLNTGTWFQNILTQPGRSLNAGYSWPGGFPPRSKWTYGEVFHPAVVPQPPFNNNQANSFSLAVNKKTKNKHKNRRILTISTNRTSCISQNRSMVFPTGVN